MIDQQFHVGIGVVGIFRRDGVRSQESWDEINDVFGIQQPNGIEHTHFSFSIQPVTSFTLNRGSAMSEHPIQSRFSLLDQIRQSRPTSLPHRSGDPSTGCHDLLVAGPRQPLFEFLHAIPCPDQVRVRIY